MNFYFCNDFENIELPLQKQHSKQFDTVFTSSQYKFYRNFIFYLFWVQRTSSALITFETTYKSYNEMKWNAKSRSLCNQSIWSIYTKI